MATYATTKNIPGPCNVTASVHARVDCNICAEEVSSRRIIACPFCTFEACISCTERFLMDIDDDKPRCMSPDCKKVWTYEFLASKFSPSFHNGKYRKRRTTLLYEREKSLLPGTQPLVKMEKKKAKNQIKIDALRDENEMYLELIRINKRKIRDIEFTTGGVNGAGEGVGKEAKKERTFTRACPVNDCRGFLSTSLKCGTCNTYACKDCHLPKASKDDAIHKCDPDTVATVALLATDTKQCPACATPIFKIHGCDQMYCTQCHTPFSWTRGTIETGVIHNPHFYEAQKALNGGVAPRNPGDYRCGGPPPLWDINIKLRQARISEDVADKISSLHRLINHITHVEIPRYPNRLGEMDNTRMRVNYLMGKIDEKQWQSKLMAKMKKQEKNGAINDVLTMFNTTSSDLLGNITECKTHEVVKYIESLEKLREYTNKSLVKIGQRFGNVSPCIEKDWTFHQNHLKTSPKQKKNYPHAVPRLGNLGNVAEVWEEWDEKKNDEY